MPRNNERTDGSAETLNRGLQTRVGQTRENARKLGTIDTNCDLNNDDTNL